MTRLGQVMVTGAMLALILTLVVFTVPAGDGSPAGTWGSAQTIPETDPGFWRARSGAADAAPRTYSAGMSDLVAMSRIGIAPGGALDLTNMAAAGAFVLESGELILTGAEGTVELRRGESRVATTLAPLGIGSKLERGDRIAFATSVTVAVRNPGEAIASLLVIAGLPGRPATGVVQ